MTIDVRLATDEASFDGLRGDWQRLSGRGAGDGLFGSYLWNRIWWRFYGELGELRIMVAEEGGRVIGIWPLFLARRSFHEVETDMIGPRRMVLPGKAAKLRVLAYLGSGEICSDYLAPLVEPGREAEAVDAMLAHLAGRNDWDLLDLCDMPADDPTLPAITEGLDRHLGKTRRRHRYQAPYAPLAPTYDEYLNTLSKKGRYNARKKTRQLQLNREVKHFFHHDPATLNEALDRLMELHRQRWEEEGLPGVFVNERFVGFHRAIAAEALARDWLRLGFLRVDGETLFSTYAFRVSGRLYLYQQGGNANWHHYNLGYAALGFTVAAACEEGCEVYDFLRGDAEYKGHWARQSRELVQLQAVRRGLRGRLFMIHSTINTDDAVRARIKRAVLRK